jgi:hypothetical protein
MAGCTRTTSRQIAAARTLSNECRVRPEMISLDLSLLGYLECVVNLDSNVSRGAFQFGMAKQELNSPKVFSSACISG